MSRTGGGVELDTALSLGQRRRPAANEADAFEIVVARLAECERRRLKRRDGCSAMSH